MKYKSRMNYDKTDRKKNSFIIIILLILAIIIGGIFWFINEKSEYDEFNQYNEDNKSIGEVKHYKDESDYLYVSLYYPETESKKLNKIIDEYYKNYLKEQKVNKKSKDVIYMDYSINEAYKQFVNLNLKLSRFDENGKVISTTNKLFSYDLKMKKF